MNKAPQKNKNNPSLSITRKNDANSLLTRLASSLHDTDVARGIDIQNRIRAALVADAQRRGEISREMEKVAVAHNRYLALQREEEAHEKSTQGLMALLGSTGFGAAMENDKTGAIASEIEILPDPDYLRNQKAVWEHVAQLLRFVPEEQVGEIVGILSLMGIKTTRQAIEAAVRTHPDTFVMKKRGRERFVSLK